MSNQPNFSSNSDYYAAREVEEKRMAMAARDSNVRAIHLEMAEQYERLAESGEGPTDLPRGENLRA